MRRVKGVVAFYTREIGMISTFFDFGCCGGYVGLLVGASGLCCCDGFGVLPSLSHGKIGVTLFCEIDALSSILTVSSHFVAQFFSTAGAVLKRSLSIIRPFNARIPYNFARGNIFSGSNVL